MPSKGLLAKGWVMRVVSQRIAARVWRRRMVVRGVWVAVRY